MSVTEILQNIQFVVDVGGDKKAVLLDYSLWEELLTQLETWKMPKKFDVFARLRKR